MSSQRYEETTGWVDWGIFAAMMMVLGGVVNVLFGFVAVVSDDWVVWANRDAVYLDLSTWGWVQMVVGGLVVLAGLGVLRGNVVARTVGVVLAAASVFSNFFLVPVHPFWALTVITLDVLVIWALTAHGHELRVPRT
jgi:hypothetical protein